MNGMGGIKELTHAEVQDLLTTGEVLTLAQRASLNRHLSTCAECQGYAAFIKQLENTLQEATPSVSISEAESRSKARHLHQTLVKRQRLWRFFNGMQNLAWAGGALLLVAFLAWSIQNAISRPSASGPERTAAALNVTPTLTQPTALPATENATGNSFPTQNALTPAPTETSGQPVIATQQPEKTPLPVEPTVTPSLTTTYPTTRGWSDSGLLAFVSSRGGYPAIYKARLDGSGMALVTAEISGIANPTWSPDGTQIAFQAYSKENGLWDIFVINSDGTGLKNLTNSPSEEHDPAWSPDGTQIAFVSNLDRADRTAIYVIEADGSEPDRLSRNMINVSRPAWSPDGKRVAFSAASDGNPEIYIVKVDSQEVVRLTDNPAADTAPTWSPTSRKIAFASDRDGSSEIYVMRVDGAGQTRVTNDADWNSLPSWSPEGDWIAFVKVAAAETQSGIYVIDENGTVTARLEGSQPRDTSPAWSNPAGAIIPEGPTSRPTDTPAPSATPTPETVADPKTTLIAFFTLLNEKKYAQAAELYGGSYEELINLNPTVDPRDHAALLKNACEINGYQCLKVRTVELHGEPPLSSDFSFLVEFQNEDGSLFVFQPSSGADGTPAAPISQFIYHLEKNSAGRLVVMQLPVYIG